MARTRLFVCTLAFMGATYAAGAATPALKVEASVSGDIVYIGDLIAHAGAAAEIPIFRAPDLGQTGAVLTARVLEAVRRHGLEDVDTHGLTEIAVTRVSRSFSVKEIEERIAAALAGRLGLGEARNLAVTFDREVRSLHVEATAGDLKVARASFDQNSGRFDVSFDVAESAVAKRMRLRYTGTIVEAIDVVMLARSVTRGDVIRASDATIERRPRSAIAAGALDKAEQVIGLAARRPLQPGQALRAADLMKPELVRQNETVTVLYDVPGISLSVRGKALESGAEGDLVNVLNVQSKRTMQGTVTGLGRVTIAAPTPAVLAKDPETTSSIAATAPRQHTE